MLLDRIGPTVDLGQADVHWTWLLVERRREVARSNDPEFAERAIALIPGSAVLGIWHIHLSGIRLAVEVFCLDAVTRRK